jgi:PAS domain S-box-containing protein
MNPSAHILVVDDDPEICRATAHLLSQAGYQVLQTGTGEGALRLAQEARPDLVLLDVSLPDLDGYEVCRRLKAAAPLEAPFVVHCSSQLIRAEYVARGFEAGGDGYIARPVANGELLARVQAFLRHRATLVRLHASERLYRSQFEQNPQPAWIVATDTRLVLTANAAAVQLYGYAPEELPGLPFARLFPDGADEAFWGTPEAAGPAARRGAFPQRRKGGGVFASELLSHPVEWGGRPACAVLVTDVSDRIELAAELARQRAALDGEMRQLAAWSGAILPVTAQALGIAPLSEAAPEIFRQLQDQYGALLDLALRERVLRVEKEVSTGLRALASRLCFLRAGPRDVIELHYRALQARTRPEESVRARGYLEVGRQTVLECMGSLVAAYRHASAGGPLTALPRPGPD